MTPREYDGWYDTPRGRWVGDREWSMLAGQLGLRADDTLLDVGCGTGWFTRRAAAQAAHVTGIDIDTAALDFARRKGGEAGLYVAGDATRLPFPDRAFDVVMSVAALCFVADWPRALAEMSRVGRRRLAVGLLHRPSRLHWQKGRAGRGSEYEGAHWHTRTEVADALAALPVEDVRFEFGIFAPSGGSFARAAERCVPSWLPLGSFMVIAATPRVATA